MFGAVWKWAGKFRASDKNLGVQWAHIETSLHTLLANLSHWEREEMEFLEQAVLLHHRAVSIHPFENGNGRWARLLANIWLKLNDSPLTEWPETTVGSVSTIRSDYLTALRHADSGEYGPLRELHRRFTREH